VSAIVAKVRESAPKATWGLAQAVAHLLECMDSQPPAVVVVRMRSVWRRNMTLQALVQAAEVGLVRILGDRVHGQNRSMILGAVLSINRRYRMAKDDHPLILPLVGTIRLVAAGDSGKQIDGLHATIQDWLAAAERDSAAVAGLQDVMTGKRAIAQMLQRRKVRCALDLPRRGAELDGLVRRYWKDGMEE